MKLNLDADPGMSDELLEFTVGGVDYRYEGVELYRLSDDLNDEWRGARVEEVKNDAEFNSRLRKVFEKHQIALPEKPFMLPNILTQRIMAQTGDERKKFESGLWGTTDDSPAWGVSTPESARTS